MVFINTNFRFNRRKGKKNSILVLIESIQSLQVCSLSWNVNYSAVHLIQTLIIQKSC